MSTPTAIRKTPAVIATPRTKRALLARHHIVAPSLRVAEAAAASVFGAARLRGPIARDVIAQTTGLSVDTLKKMLPLLAMVAAGLLAKQSGGASGGGSGGQGGGLLGQIGGMLGGAGQGAGGLGQLLDQDGNGNPLVDMLCAAGKMFGK